MLFSVIFAVCCKKNTEQTNALCGENLEFVSDEAGDVMCVVTAVFRGLQLAM
jgi:hypothetical protein